MKSNFTTEKIVKVHIFLREWPSEIKPKDTLYVVKKEPEIRERNSGKRK